MDITISVPEFSVDVYSELLRYAHDGGNGDFLRVLKQDARRLQNLESTITSSLDLIRDLTIKEIDKIKIDMRGLEERIKPILRIEQNTLMIAQSLGNDVALAYWQIFFKDHDVFGRKEEPFYFSSLNGAADGIKDTVLLIPELALPYINSLARAYYTLFEFASLQAMSHSSALPQSSEFLLYASKTNSPDTKDALNGMNISQFALSLDRLSTRIDARKLFFELLVDTDAMFEDYYLFKSESLARKGNHMSQGRFKRYISWIKDSRTNREVFVRAKEFLDRGVKVPPILNIASDCLGGSIDLLLIYAGFRNSAVFLDNHLAHVRQNKDTLRSLGYLMLAAQRIDGVTADATFAKRDYVAREQIDGIPLAQKLCETAASRKINSSAQVLEAVLCEDSKALAAIYSPVEKTQPKPAPPPQKIITPDEVLKQDYLQASQQGVALFSFTDVVAKKQAERIQCPHISQFYSQMLYRGAQGPAFVDSGISEVFFENGYGIHIINQESEFGPDESALVVYDLLQKNPTPRILVVGADSFKDAFVSSLQQLAPVPPMLHYRAPNGYINSPAITLNDLITSSVAVFS